VDPAWWNDIAQYLKSSGVTTYEQDWLADIFVHSPEFSSDTGMGEAFLDDMAHECGAREITLQYCMPYPCHFLQGSRYKNLTTIRTSDDRFNTNRWNDFLYTSRLASAMGIWPWTDVFMSRETQNILLATLSAGPVGIGDAIGAEDKSNLLCSVRADGVIVKPDAPITPLDSVYLADARKLSVPIVASTFTDHTGFKTGYVFAFNRSKITSGLVDFSPDDIGCSGDAYVYDYFAGTGRLLERGVPFSAPLAENGSVFYEVAPIGKSRIALLGDKNKFVGTGKQRICSLSDNPGGLKASVLLAANESSITLHGYAAARPGVTVTPGKSGPVQFDSATGYFTVEITASQAARIDNSSVDPVRRIEVVLNGARN
jgi:hypothetical protein